jgi:hypothetical protein
LLPEDLKHPTEPFKWVYVYVRLLVFLKLFNVIVSKHQAVQKNCSR